MTQDIAVVMGMQRVRGATEVRWSMRMAIAEAVADPECGARVVRTNNELDPRRLSVREAVLRDVAFCVVPRRDVVAIDGDGPGNLVGLTAVHDLLAEHGIEAVILASGGAAARTAEPRHHLWARITDDCLATAVEPALQALVHRYRLDWRYGPEQRIRPPFTAHRSGCAMTLVTPVSARAALAALSAAHSLDSAPDVTTRKEVASDPPRGALQWSGGPGNTHARRDLPTRIRRLLREGDLLGRYQSASEVMLAVACSAHQAGWEFEEFREQMLDPSNGGAAHAHSMLSDRGSRQRDRAIKRAWDAAVQFTEENPASADLEPEVIGLIERVDLIDWSAPRWVTEWMNDTRLAEELQRTVATDAAVYRAHLRAAAKAGRLQHDLSERDLADWAGVGSRSTVRRSRERLRVRGLLNPVTQPGRPCTYAAAWLLRVPRTDPRTSRPPAGVEGNSMSRIDVGHDVWRWGGGGAFGKRALLIAQLVEFQPLTFAEVYGGMPSSKPKTVQRHLHRMQSAGMVIERDGRWHWLDPDLDRLAESLGIPNRSDRQHGRVALERAIFERMEQERVEADRQRRRRSSQVRRTSAQARVESLPPTHTPVGGRELSGSVRQTRRVTRRPNQQLATQRTTTTVRQAAVHVRGIRR